MSTGVVQVGKKGKTRRATGIDDNPYDHNEGEDQTALVNAALWNMKDVYQTLMAGESLSEDDMFSYGDLVQYLEQADMPDHYSKFWDLVTDAINSAGGFKGQGDEIMVDKNIAPQIKTLYQQFKAATANVKGVKEGGNRIYIPDPEIPMPRLLRVEWQPDVTRALRKAAGLPDSAYVYFDDADLVYGEKTVWPMCGVDDKCTFGDAVKALKKFAKANPFDGERHFKEDDVDAVYPGSGDIYGYTWNCKKCGTENEFSMSRKDAQEYIDDWEADNEDLVADGETGEAALTDTLSQGEDSGFHIGDKCVKCGTEVKDYPYNETISDILKLSGLK
jgi:DNA-directed RNA polymerase subunit M/transcription elongation factor TFIIS